MTREEFNQKKVWLWRYQRSRNHERQLRQQIQSERERATATTKALSPVVVSAGGKNKIEDAVCRIMERQEALYKQIIETEMQREEIETAINSVQDQMQRDVLRERYIVGTPYWWKIAINLNISERWAKPHAKTSRRDIFAKKNFSQKGKSQKVIHKAATGKNTVP